MRNPLRSEDEAFSFLLRAVGVFLVLIALILLARAIL